MITVRATITPDLAITVGELAREHSDCAVTIAYDDEYPEQEWLVQFDRGYGQITYVVDDETGEHRLAGMGEGRKLDRTATS